MSHKYDSVFICKILISNEPTVKTVLRHFRIISERKKESRIKVETSVLRWPYFQFGLSNNYGANFYTWEFEKGCACCFWIVDSCNSNRQLRVSFVCGSPIYNECIIFICCIEIELNKIIRIHSKTNLFSFKISLLNSAYILYLEHVGKPSTV